MIRFMTQIMDERFPKQSIENSPEWVIDFATSTFCHKLLDENVRIDHVINKTKIRRAIENCLNFSKRKRPTFSQV
jgi:hypothetical protein